MHAKDPGNLPESQKGVSYGDGLARHEVLARGVLLALAIHDGLNIHDMDGYLGPWVSRPHSSGCIVKSYVNILAVTR